VQILQDVDHIAAEDTRHSRPLLRHFGIDTPLLALHEHNEEQILGKITARLQQGESVALISDAGTPLISDPGFLLLRECHRLGIKVSPLPGPSAAITALSVAGLPSDRFRFIGFLQRGQSARLSQLEELSAATETLIFYEAGNRLQVTIKDMAEVFGGARSAVLARELTKLHETIVHTTLSELLQLLEDDTVQTEGECVLIIGSKEQEADKAEISSEAERVLRILLEELSVKQASALASRITGAKKNLLYQMALTIKDDASV
jgi:16S rRNA (cytidine1402-2'-O)-methyltransferase